MEYNPFTECGLSHSLYGINLLLLIKEILLAAAKDLVHTAIRTLLLLCTTLTLH